VQDEFERRVPCTGIQRAHQELASAVDPFDAPFTQALEIVEPRVRVRIPPHPDDAAARQPGEKLPADGLDLGELWHTGQATRAPLPSRLRIAAGPASVHA